MMSGISTSCGALTVRSWVRFRPMTMISARTGQTQNGVWVRMARGDMWTSWWMGHGGVR